MEKPKISAIASDREAARLTICGLPSGAEASKLIWRNISRAKIEVDKIVQDVDANGRRNISFTIQRGHYEKVFAILRQTGRDLGVECVRGEPHIGLTF